MSGYLQGSASKPFIPGIIQFRYTENTGAAFGFFSNMKPFLITVTSVLIIALLYIIVSERFSSKLINISLVLITAGGIGNLYDRIVHGYVVDYLEFTFVNYAIFNFADALINVGAVLLFISFFSFEKKQNKTKNPSIISSPDKNNENYEE